MGRRPFKKSFGRYGAADKRTMVVRRIGCAPRHAPYYGVFINYERERDGAYIPLDPPDLARLVKWAQAELAEQEARKRGAR